MDSKLIWSIDINQNIQLIPYLTIVQRVVKFQYIWEILFIVLLLILLLTEAKMTCLEHEIN